MMIYGRLKEFLGLEYENLKPVTYWQKALRRADIFNGLKLKLRQKQQVLAPKKYLATTEYSKSVSFSNEILSHYIFFHRSSPLHIMKKLNRYQLSNTCQKDICLEQCLGDSLCLKMISLSLLLKRFQRSLSSSVSFLHLLLKMG